MSILLKYPMICFHSILYKANFVHRVMSSSDKCHNQMQFPYDKGHIYTRFSHNTSLSSPLFIKVPEKWMVLYVCIRGNWYCLFLRFSYWILELFRQYGILRISIYSNMNYIFLHTHRNCKVR